jgi:trehalose 6-phosphate synthase
MSPPEAIPLRHDARDERRVVIASNRGPVSFVRERGKVIPKRGTGGLVTALAGAVQAAGALWIASAMSDEDRRQASRGHIDVGDGDAPYAVRYLAIDADRYDEFYNQVSNRILWMLHHCLWDAPRVPTFDEATARAWSAYREVNHQFAEALDEEGDADFLIQDYHLVLAPAMLRERRPKSRIAHFSHIPFVGPPYLRVLPRPYRLDLLTGLLGADVIGFQSTGWADNFLVDCRELRGATVNLRARTIRWQGRTVSIGVYPISIDAGALLERSRQPEVERSRERLEEIVGDRALLLRVDRAELSKNILRGFLSFELLLNRHPQWRERVVFLALLNPSREDVPEYGEYVDQCVEAAARVNDRFGTSGWTPIDLYLADDFPMAIAGYERYDVLLVNPTFDGMNLVSKEGPILNRRGGVLVLSENAGAFAELGRYALPVSPFDIAATAGAIREGLEMDPGERARRAGALRRAVRRGRLEDWVGRQREDLDAAAAARLRPAIG